MNVRGMQLVEQMKFLPALVVIKKYILEEMVEIFAMPQIMLILPMYMILMD